MRTRKSRPFRHDRVYLADDEVERLTQCGCATCVTLRQSLGHDSAGRACLREEALARERVLDHLERVLGRAVDFGDPATPRGVGDPLRVSPFAPLGVAGSTTCAAHEAGTYAAA